MSSVGIILDGVKLVAGVALTYFVFYLYQKEFRSGVMEKGFRMIAISMLIFTVGLSFDLISAIQTANELASILATVIGTAFSLVATYGFFLLYRVWHVDRKEARLEKTINA
jgi:Kef-type K+ transport system membrane component KefB